MYPHKASEEAKQIQEDYEKICEDIKSQRVDISDKLVLTIDNSSTKALDDAVSLKSLENGNFELQIHISDVASLIKPGSFLDEEALKRASSTYVLRDFFIPMLP